MRTVVSRSVLAVIALAACDANDSGPLSTGPEPAAPARVVGATSTGAVYTLSNAADGNTVVTFLRAADGTLTPGPVVPTGGLGLGAGLGSQGALVRRAAGDLLFAVNAGSDQISVLRLTGGTTPTPLVTGPSGGDRPVSVTVRGNLVYVLNAGDGNNIAGFTLRAEPGQPATLTPIPGSVRPLSAPNAGGAQIEFTPRGDALIVTEKNTNRILRYPLASGVAGAATITPSAGMTPFGFTFGGAYGDVLLVSEAFGGAPNASAASSYKVGLAGALTLVSASVPTHQTAACWFVATLNGASAFATNTGSASISRYHVEPDGVLRLNPATGVAATTGAGPIDAARTPDGVFLYALASVSHQIDGYAIGGNPGLTHVETQPGTPPAAAGLVAK